MISVPAREYRIVLPYPRHRFPMENRYSYPSRLNRRGQTSTSPRATRFGSLMEAITMKYMGYSASRVISAAAV